MKKFKSIHYLQVALCFTLSIGISSCSDDDTTTSNPSVALQNQYTNTRCNVLELQPQLENLNAATLQWAVVETPAGKVDSLIGTNPALSFIALNEGNYTLALRIAKDAYRVEKRTTIHVTKEQTPYSPYIASVYDFLPAVGQFSNQLPEYEAGDTPETMRQKAEDAIKGGNTSMISLGGFGGYVVFGFDHTIVNITGKKDFRVKGNAFYAASNPNPNAPKGGSCEPGIILVAYDKNKNGKPDDNEWYEIAGSEYSKPSTIKNYEITYYKPNPDKQPVVNPNMPWANDTEYIRWEDNQGKSGYKIKNKFSQESYYPEWITADKLTFRGTLLPNNAKDESSTESYWVMYAFDWGYADNHPNSTDESAIDIDWAVDNTGKRVKLPGIDFVKVYTGVNQEAGQLGEVSTEVAGAEDLHLLNK